MQVRAQDLGTGKEQKIKVRSSSGLSEDQIKNIIVEAEDHAAEDAASKLLAEAKNELESLIFTSEKSINEFQNGLSSEIIERVTNALAEAKKSLSSPDIAAVEFARGELNDAAHSLAEAIYGQIAGGN